MRKIIFFIIVSLCMAAQLYAAQSTIKIAEGSACMGDDKTRKQTETLAMTDAKRIAIESVKTHITSSTQVKNFELQKDLVSTYANATVEVIEEMQKGWYNDPSMGNCYKVKIKTEVIPDERAIKIAVDSLTLKDRTQLSRPFNDLVLDDPSLPLAVKVWMDKETYREGEKMKIYLKGNKPFFARVIYRDAAKKDLQILPSPFRQDNYFQGGVTYVIPSGKDKFELEVNPPFGEENIIIYASVAQLGDLNLKTEDAVFAVITKAQDIGIKSRSVKIKDVSSGNDQQMVEFFEGVVIVNTKK